MEISPTASNWKFGSDGNQRQLSGVGRWSIHGDIPTNDDRMWDARIHTSFESPPILSPQFLVQEPHELVAVLRMFRPLLYLWFDRWWYLYVDQSDAVSRKIVEPRRSPLHEPLANHLRILGGRTWLVRSWNAVIWFMVLSRWNIPLSAQSNTSSMLALGLLGSVPLPKVIENDVWYEVQPT